MLDPLTVNLASAFTKVNLSNVSRSPLRVCVCTSYGAAAEPRAPRHAAAIAALGSEFEVTFVDMMPVGQTSRPVKCLEQKTNLKCKTHYFPHRRAGLPRLIVNRFRQSMAQILYRLLGRLQPLAVSAGTAGFGRILEDVHADVYFAHNIDALLPAAGAAERHGAKLMFDCMELYAEMGGGQSPLERDMIKKIEAKWLPRCSLVTSSSDELSDELSAVYKIPRPLALYNVPPIEPCLPPRLSGSFSLYWRNSCIGLGQRGLDDALVALKHLPADITLHLQGGQPIDGGAKLKSRLAELGIANRVFIHPPYHPEDAVKEAAKYTIGLCLERPDVRNHHLTVSNKMFDYLMAGLVVVSSGLPSLRNVITKSGGGLLYRSGDPVALAEQIMALYQNRALLDKLSSNARAFALTTGNRESEMRLFQQAFRASVIQTP